MKSELYYYINNNFIKGPVNINELKQKIEKNQDVLVLSDCDSNWNSQINSNEKNYENSNIDTEYVFRSSIYGYHKEIFYIGIISFVLFIFFIPFAIYFKLPEFMFIIITMLLGSTFGFSSFYFGILHHTFLKICNEKFIFKNFLFQILINWENIKEIIYFQNARILLINTFNAPKIIILNGLLGEIKFLNSFIFEKNQFMLPVFFTLFHLEFDNIIKTIELKYKKNLKKEKFNFFIVVATAGIIAIACIIISILS